MENLKGRTILVGKEPGNGRLLVAIQGNGKSAAIGSPGCVPACVSRCKPAEGVAHVKITVNQNGDMVLTNMKSQNVTYVNGSEIASKHVALNSTVELGKDKFNINLPAVINVAEQLAAVTQKQRISPKSETPKRKFNITHLERVWDEFHEKELEIRKRQKQQGLYASLPMFFTLGGGAITFVLSYLLGEEYKGSIQILSGILVVVGLIMLIYSFMRRKNDTSIEDSDNNFEDFQFSYVCPNPDCHKFLGRISYRLLKNQLRNHKDQKMYCPHCGSEFVEK